MDRIVNQQLGLPLVAQTCKTAISNNNAKFPRLEGTQINQPQTGWTACGYSFDYGYGVSSSMQDELRPLPLFRGNEI
jgi:hypothetical protein